MGSAVDLLTYPFIILDVDISSLVSEVSNCVMTARQSCHIQGSILTETMFSIHWSKSSILSYQIH